MKLADAILWPGTKVCEYFGVNPVGENALLRWMVNTFVYLLLSLFVVWIIVA